MARGGRGQDARRARGASGQGCAAARPEAWARGALAATWLPPEGEARTRGAVPLSPRRRRLCFPPRTPWPRGPRSRVGGGLPAWASGRGNRAGKGASSKGSGRGGGQFLLALSGQYLEGLEAGGLHGVEAPTGL